jgi:hypothetical protein
MLTLFAQQASATDPDHVLQFSAAESYRHGAQLAAPSPTALAQPVFTPIEATFCSPHGPQPSSVPPHPPPDEGGRLVRLRSIQLLV